jgi:hypothetical protein
MRRIALLALFVVTGNQTPVAAQLSGSANQSEFDLNECASRATHILVVDRRGQVVDVWKGNAGLGQAVPIDTIISPAVRLMHAPSSLRVRLDTSSSWSDNLQSRDRFIVFLVKSSTLLPSMPTLLDDHDEEECRVSRHFSFERDPDDRIARRIARDGWLPASQIGGFVCSMAFVDDFGLVRTRQMTEKVCCHFFYKPELVPEWRVVGTEDVFKQRVFETMRGYSFDYK